MKHIFGLVQFARAVPCTQPGHKIHWHSVFTVEQLILGGNKKAAIELIYSRLKLCLSIQRYHFCNWQRRKRFTNHLICAEWKKNNNWQIKWIIQFCARNNICNEILFTPKDVSLSKVESIYDHVGRVKNENETKAIYFFGKMPNHKVNYFHTFLDWIVGYSECMENGGKWLLIVLPQVSIIHVRKLLFIVMISHFMKMTWRNYISWLECVLGASSSVIKFEMNLNN